jgi:prepilin-type N-terminal cleavage/methylation domain-containing protein
MADRNARVRDGAEDGFSLIEVMIAMLVVTIGLIGMAQLMAVTTVVHSDARETSMGTELAQAKLDEFSGMNLASDAEVQIGGDLDADVANYFDAPASGITRRWLVEAGPTTGTRILTLRVINTASRQYGDSLYFRTMLRQW